MPLASANDNRKRPRAEAPMRVIPLVGQVGPDGRVTFYDTASEMLAPWRPLPRAGQLVDL